MTPPRAPKAPPAPSWLTGRADTGGVPALLERLSNSIPIATIDELWLFPTRRLTGVESTVIVLSLYTDEHDRRRVATVHFKATRNKRGEATVETLLEDHAVAPADRLTRVIDGVLRRLGDDLSSSPRAARISGETDRYEALIEAIASNIELEDALERVRERPARDQGSGIEDRGSGIVEDGSGITDQVSGPEEEGSGIAEDGSGITDQGSGVDDRGSDIEGAATDSSVDLEATMQSEASGNQGEDRVDVIEEHESTNGAGNR